MATINQNIQRERRKLLIDATITAIAEFGLSKLTLAKIGSIAGLTAGTVNFHFKSKESLLLETLNFVSEEFDQSIAKALEKTGSKPSKRLGAIINASLDPEITEHRKMAVWHETIINLSVANVTERILSLFFSFVSKLFARRTWKIELMLGE